MERAPSGRRGSGLRGRLGGALAALAVGTLSVAGLAGTAHAANGDVAVNGGFESGLAGWTCTAGSGTTVSSPVHGGSSALRATPSGQDDAQCSETVSVQPNSTYTLGAWVQGGYAYLGAQNTGTSNVETWTPPGSAWTHLTTTFTTGASTTTATVYLHGWYGQSAYLADDVTVVGPAGSGTGPVTQPPAAPGGLASGTVTSSSVGLSWTASSGATGYNVYENGTRVQSVTGTSATVTGLSASTSYQFQVSATNTAGESAKSGAVTVTTSASGGGSGPTSPSVPAHAVTGYWQDFSNGATVQKLSAVPSQYDIIAVAFATATSTPGQISFSLDPAVGYSSVDQFKADIAAKQAQGKSVVLSVGGETGTVSVNSAAAATAFANSAYSLMQSYGFNGVDIDLENGVNSTYMSSALHQLAAKAGSGFVLTMAPQTLDMQSTGTEYFKTALAVKDILTVVNTQYYNSGTMLGCDGKVYGEGTEDFLTALACIQLQSGLAPSQVGLGLPATQSAGAGYVSPSVVNNALDCLAKGTNCGSFKPPTTWPGIRGAMTWDTNWDASSGNAWINTVGPHVHAL